jgi:predicted MFS family arabinose efflux permease
VRPLSDPNVAIESGVADRDSRTANTALAIATLLSVSFAVLLPVIPVIVEKHGRPGDAGAATAALLGTTVVSEFLTPALMTRFSSRMLAAGGMFIIGATCGLYFIPNLDVRTILVITAMRGVGLGVAGVVCMSLSARHSTPEGRGVAMGIYGSAFTLPLVIFPPLGLFLLGAGYGGAAAAIAGVAGIAGAVAALWLKDPATSAPLDLRRWRPGRSMFTTLLTLVIVNMTFGAVVSFIPVIYPVGGLLSAATFLLVSGIARSLGRLASGFLADRFSASTVMLIGAAAAAAGLLALPVARGSALVLAGAFVYGAGAGAVQTTGFLSMLISGRSTDVRVVTAAWNTAVDVGSTSGAALLGLVAAGYGYPAVLWVLPFLAAVAIPSTLISMREAPAAS